MHDLVIRRGSVVDGTGAATRTADVAMKDGRIAEVGDRLGPARQEVDADGALVLPGWVDIHTHYDGQATWDPLLTPSSWHGVTTTVFGNCGVGFAPIRPGTEDYLINLMEGVEDIPGTVLAEGLDFSWESYPQYLDALAAAPKAMDVAAQVPHGALRFYVMGERGADHGIVPSEDEIAAMERLMQEALSAGAMGFSTSRTTKHRAADGRFTPSLSAQEPELAGIARAMKRAGAGTIQCNSDFGDGEFEILRAMAELSGRPLSVLLLQVDNAPELWRRTLAQIEATNRDGLYVTGQVGTRPIGILMGLDTSINPFTSHPAWRGLKDLAPAERVARLQADGALRRRLVEERPDDGHTRWMGKALERSFALGEPLDYEPAAEESVAARAAREGRDRWALALELMLERDGTALLMHSFENYNACSLDALREMLLSENTVSGLGDGGAHVATICDASAPTTLLTIWARDRKRGERLPLEFLVRKQTRDAARVFGLLDRGVLAPGYRADINVVDFDALAVGQPRVVHDLPAGGRRLAQRASGYRHTFVAGVEVTRDGEHTGALPGGLVRGARPAP
ncbi:MAG TPA: amidohydrolase family protein [Alphaproteobacteria bacterium]|nr:amidohydrolase family protein [Alphaproteobacteria bacterium]